MVILKSLDHISRYATRCFAQLSRPVANRRSEVLARGFQGTSAGGAQFEKPAPGLSKRNGTASQLFVASACLPQAIETRGESKGDLPTQILIGVPF